VGGLTAISHCRLELERLTISCRCDAACPLNTQETINKLTVYAEDSRPTVNKQLGLTFNPTAIVLPPLPPTVEVAVLVNFSNRRLSLIISKINDDYAPHIMLTGIDFGVNVFIRGWSRQDNFKISFRRI